MNDLPGRGDVNPYGIPMPNPHEREGPDEEDCCAEATQLREALREIRDTEWIDNALDPQRPARIARVALGDTPDE